jgi:hypothetical protein
VPRFHDPSESAVLRIGKSKLRFAWASAETALSGELTGDAKFRSSKSTRTEMQSVENEAIMITKSVQRKEREFKEREEKDQLEAIDGNQLTVWPGERQNAHGPGRRAFGR